MEVAIEEEVSSQRRQQQRRLLHEGALQRIEQVRLDWVDAQDQLGAKNSEQEEDE